MFAFLAPKLPPRTRTAHLNPIPFDDGASTVTFLPDTSRYLVVNRWPPYTPGKTACSLAPGLHWHYDQEETFHVLKGTAKFELNGTEIVAQEHQMVTIPAGVYHKFWNASTTEGMQVEFILEPKRRERDERFFRNIQSYRDDCRKHGIPRSLPQVLLFMRAGGVIMALPGPRSLAKLLGMLLNFVGGLLIGQLLLGYSDSYEEYHHPNTE